MILRLLDKVFRYTGLKATHYHSPKIWGHHLNGQLLDRAAAGARLDFVSYTSADTRYLGDASSYRGFHVIRDPRDIVVSSYFSHRYSHPTDGWPELVEFRRVLERLPKDEGILENMKFTEVLPIDGHKVDLFRTLRDWDYSMPNVLELKFEHLVANPYQAFLDALEFVGMTTSDDGIDLASALRLAAYELGSRHPRFRLSAFPSARLPPWLILRFVHENRFSRLAGGRSEGQEDVRSHYRKGKTGDWKNHFTDLHKRVFKERYNDLLVKLGYEQDDSW